MLPEVYRAEAVAKEIIAERERRLARRQLLAELPPVESAGLVMLHRAAHIIGGQLITAGEWLRRYGHNELNNDMWTGRSFTQETNA